MFVRWSDRAGRLSAALVQSARSGHRVSQEHIGSLGSIPSALADGNDASSLSARRAFWKSAESALSRLSNRVSDAEVAMVRAQLHARVPMVAPADLHRLALSQAEGDERFWQGHVELLRDTIADRIVIIEEQQRIVASAQRELAVAEQKAAEASDKARRARAGELVGEVEPVTVKRFTQLMINAGWSPRKVRRFVEKARRA